MARKKIAEQARDYAVFLAYNFTCVSCGEHAVNIDDDSALPTYDDCMEALLEVDHIDPRKNGGDNALDNLACRCHFCNNRKNGTLNVPYFAPRFPEANKVTILRNRRAWVAFIKALRVLNKQDAK
jgi:5-methylcytosine-specific restriction endonuclease McrA